MSRAANDPFGEVLGPARGRHDSAERSFAETVTCFMQRTNCDIVGTNVIAVADPDANIAFLLSRDGELVAVRRDYKESFAGGTYQSEVIIVNDSPQLPLVNPQARAAGHRTYQHRMTLTSAATTFGASAAGRALLIDTGFVSDRQLLTDLYQSLTTDAQEILHLLNGPGITAQGVRISDFADSITNQFVAETAFHDRLAQQLRLLDERGLVHTDRGPFLPSGVENLLAKIAADGRLCLSFLSAPASSTE